MGIEEVRSGSPDGHVFGQAATTKIAFYGTTPVVQPTSASQAAVTTSVTTTRTTTAVYTDVEALIVLANQLRAELVELGLIAGS
jgi:hypothetical protein